LGLDPLFHLFISQFLLHPFVSIFLLLFLTLFLFINFLFEEENEMIQPRYFWVLLLSKMYVWYYDGYNRIVVIYCDFTEVIKWNFISIVTLNITEIVLCTGANHWMMQERWGACQYDDKNQWLSCELWYMLLWILIKLRSIYQMSPSPKSYSWTN
jgi:hypothetical protein